MFDAAIFEDPSDTPDDDQFDIVRRVGKGAMGVVFEGRHRDTKNPVALKVSLDEEGGAHGLAAEYDAGTTIDHPNVVRFTALVRWGGRPCLVMEYVAGRTLLDALGVNPVRGATEGADGESVEPRTAGAPDLAKLRRVFRQLADGLEAIHEAGRIHRDVKSANVIVSDDERVVVVDLGLAYPEGSPPRDGMGTPAYLAPEVCGGGGACRASDWYGFGTLLFQALTGRLPFEGSGYRILTAKLEEKAPRVGELRSDVPAELDALCAALLDPNPAQRPGPVEIRRVLAGDLAQCEA